jgi:hypothetical protein
VLYLLDYHQLFRLDPVTTAIWLVSFGLLILSILHQTMAYASSTATVLALNIMENFERITIRGVTI